MKALEFASPPGFYSPHATVDFTVMTQAQVLDYILLGLAEEIESGNGKFRHFNLQCIVSRGI
jgi:hypothetical protein